MPRALGIDHGDKRIGLALSDAGGILATPYDVVLGEAALWPVIEELIAEEGVEHIVVGLPLDMDGTEGPRARHVREFCARVAERTALPVDTWDERLTSVAAEDLLTAAGLHGHRRKARVDKVAAQLILQGWLDRPRRGA